MFQVFLFNRLLCIFCFLFITAGIEKEKRLRYSIAASIKNYNF